MGKQVTLDNDVVHELLKRAIKDETLRRLAATGLEANLSPKLFGDALREILNIDTSTSSVSQGDYPTSRVSHVQRLLDGLRDTVFNISRNGMVHKGKKWVANPNVVTITVQDALSHNLRITVYGRPEEFSEVRGALEIKPDMAGYSRFIIDNEHQLPAAIKVIEYSFKLKSKRGRLRNRPA